MQMSTFFSFPFPMDTYLNDINQQHDQYNDLVLFAASLCSISSSCLRLPGSNFWNNHHFTLPSEEKKKYSEKASETSAKDKSLNVHCLLKGV